MAYVRSLRSASSFSSILTNRLDTVLFVPDPVGSKEKVVIVAANTPMIPMPRTIRQPQSIVPSAVVGDTSHRAHGSSRLRLPTRTHRQDLGCCCSVPAQLQKMPNAPRVRITTVRIHDVVELSALERLSRFPQSDSRHRASPDEPQQSQHPHCPRALGGSGTRNGGDKDQYEVEPRRRL
jgi:hypothetical protein